jgi:hypothetical protein
MFTKTRNTLMGVALALGAASVSALELKASHQWPGGTGDLRDEMVQIIAREAEAANVACRCRSIPAVPCTRRRAVGCHRQGQPGHHRRAARLLQPAGTRNSASR